MIIIEGIVGNSNEPHWQTRLQGADIDWLDLDQWEAQKSRLRKATTKDLEVALSLDRNTHLHDGDILIWDEGNRVAVIARIQLKEVMVIDLAAVIGDNKDEIVRTVFELGHALGNQHWPAIIKGTRVYVPLTVDHKVMSSVMKTHNLPGVTYEFIPGADVIPYMAPHEARRLFGGAAAESHEHPQGQNDHDHHDHGHQHGHHH